MNEFERVNVSSVGDRIKRIAKGKGVRHEAESEGKPLTLRTETASS